MNPCRGIRRNKERASTVRIESADLSATMDRAPDHFARVMQFAYIAGVREVDILKMEVLAVMPEGLRYVESKTKKPVLITWTPVLRSLIREILEALRPKAQTDGGDRNVIGHTGQMRERYTRERKLVPVR